MPLSTFLATLLVLAAEEALRAIFDDLVGYYPLVLLAMALLRVSALAKAEGALERRIDLWLGRARRSALSAARRLSLAARRALDGVSDLVRRLRELAGLVELDFILPPVVRLG